MVGCPIKRRYITCPLPLLYLELAGLKLVCDLQRTSSRLVRDMSRTSFRLASSSGMIPLPCLLVTAPATERRCRARECRMPTIQLGREISWSNSTSSSPTCWRQTKEPSYARLCRTKLLTTCGLWLLDKPSVISLFCQTARFCSLLLKFHRKHCYYYFC